MSEERSDWCATARCTATVWREQLTGQRSGQPEGSRSLFYTHLQDTHRVNSACVLAKQCLDLVKIRQMIFPELCVCALGSKEIEEGGRKERKMKNRRWPPG